LTALLVLALCLGTLGPVFGQAQVRIKDICRIAGAREYQIIGYGLVTGLAGTGDKSPMSIEMVRGMLQNMGMDLPKTDIQTKNCAAVIVTAMIPAFGKAGENFDITISSVGDSQSLQGGVLLPTLLKGGDGNVYAVAQGHVSVGGMPAGGGAAGGGNQQKNHLTVARVPNGAIQEREVGDQFGTEGSFQLILSRKDSSVSRRVKEAIDRKYGDGWAKTTDPGTVKVTIPSSFRDDPVSFAATIEDLMVSIEEPNRLVINERTGTIIVGTRLRISAVAISHGQLKIDVGNAKPQRPNQEPQGGSLIAIQGETTVEDLVGALNAIGATPKDLISIFQAIDAAGALHGELKIM
jgi:flagellar P-ring protein precursor FlgI